VCLSHRVSPSLGRDSMKVYLSHRAHTSRKCVFLIESLPRVLGRDSMRKKHFLDVCQSKVYLSHTVSPDWHTSIDTLHSRERERLCEKDVATHSMRKTVCEKDAASVSIDLSHRDHWPRLIDCLSHRVCQYIYEKYKSVDTLAASFSQTVCLIECVTTSFS